MAEPRGRLRKGMGRWGPQRWLIRNVGLVEDSGRQHIELTLRRRPAGGREMMEPLPPVGFPVHLDLDDGTLVEAGRLINWFRIPTAGQPCPWCRATKTHADRCRAADLMGWRRDRD